LPDRTHSTPDSQTTAEEEYTMAETMTYTVPDMSCDHCRAAIIDAVSVLPRVGGVDVDLAAKRVTVSGQHLDDDALRAAIGQAGYAAL
jgi:copper chaperone